MSGNNEANVMSLVKFNATDYSLLFQVFQFCIMKKKTEIVCIYQSLKGF